MSNVVNLKDFQFQNYDRGWRHLRKDLENSQVSETERAAFVFRQVGCFIRLARIKRGHSLEEAARMFGFGTEFLSDLEQGVREIDKKVLLKICKQYQVTKEYQEFENYLRGALHPEQKKDLSQARVALEWNGLFDRRDW